MSERFIDMSDDQSSAEYDTPRMLGELTAIDAKRASVVQTAGELTIPAISHQIDLMRVDYGDEGEVKYDIDLLSKCIVAVQSQRLTIEHKVERIQAEKNEPQQVFQEATEVLAAIDKRKIEIIGQIRALEKQRSTIQSQKEMQDLKLEKDVTSNADYRSALDGRLFAQHSIAQLDQALALVLSDASKCTGKLALYSAAINQLRDTVDQAESVLIDMIRAIDNFTKVADEGVQELDVPMPEKLHDIDIHLNGRPVSYGEYKRKRDATLSQSVGPILALPDDMIQSTDSLVTTYIDVPYVYEKSQEPEVQRLPLGSLLREARVKHAKEAKPGVKKALWKRKGV